MLESSKRDVLEREWWDRWWEADYSWDGLAKRRLVGDRITLDTSINRGLLGGETLQDYWRREPGTGRIRNDHEMESVGELVRAPGRAYFHIAHVPIMWQNDTPAKQDWDSNHLSYLYRTIGQRLSSTFKSHNDPEHTDATRDGRAQFSGVVLWYLRPHVMIRDAGTQCPIRLVCRQAWIAHLTAAPEKLKDRSISVFSEKADFSHSFFASGVDFFTSVMEDETYFHGAFFGGASSFNGANFSRNITFRGAKFLGRAYFDGATFKGMTDFSGAEFFDETSFQETKFGGSVTFDSASFAKESRFTSTYFGRATSFRSVIFKQDAKFQNINEWGAAPSRWSRAFFAAKASGLISFEGSSMPPLSAFDGLHLESGASLVLDDPGYKKMTEAFSTELAEIGTKSATESSENDSVGKPNSALYSNLASGCRFLKKYFDSIGDKDLFQRFARFELEARMKGDEIGWLEKRVFAGYRRFSDFGASIVRPLAWLVCSVPIFAMLYWIIGAVWLNPISLQTKPNSELYPIQTISEVSERFFKGNFSEIDTRPMLGALSFSAHRTFPFGAWDVKAEDKDNNMRKLLLGDGEGVANFTVRVLATVQSIFSLAMIFLSGLAIRRRFKMD
jgi:hypothetical protein